MVSREQHLLHNKANAKCLDGRESSSHTGLQGFTKHLTPSGVRSASLELGPESPGCTHCTHCLISSAHLGLWLLFGSGLPLQSCSISAHIMDFTEKVLKFFLNI